MIGDTHLRDFDFKENFDGAIDSILSEFLNNEASLTGSGTKPEEENHTSGTARKYPENKNSVFTENAEGKPNPSGEDSTVVFTPDNNRENEEVEKTISNTKEDETDLYFSSDDELSEDVSDGSYLLSKYEDEGEIERDKGGFLHVMTAMLCAVVSMALLVWIAGNVHPASGSSVFSKGDTRTNIISRLDTYTNNSKAEVLSEVADVGFIRKIFTIPEDAKSGFVPSGKAYGRLQASEAWKVDEIIQKARDTGLLDGQKVIFSSAIEFYHDPEQEADIRYYYDETILVICWKELIEGRICSCVEVKIADGSQIRNKICEDTYGSNVNMYATELARQTNAVVAMNSDHYMIRDLGITVYQRQVYRFGEYTYLGFYKAYNSTDTLFIDKNGDFIFFERGTETTKEELQRYVNENDILYAVAFGPILVNNGELTPVDSYPVGEINQEYSRAGIAQYDKLHYLYMAVSHSVDGTLRPRCTVNEFGTYIHSKGVKKAYCLDGGQTGEVVMEGVPFNHIDFGNERTVSDILYFATALPETEASR